MVTVMVTMVTMVKSDIFTIATVADRRLVHVNSRGRLWSSVSGWKARETSCFSEKHPVSQKNFLFLRETSCFSEKLPVFSEKLPVS